MLTRTILALFLACLCAAQARAAGVEALSPQGEIKGIRQVTARFDVDMVPLGAPDLADPFQVECPSRGSGRWLDHRNWAYDFEQDLPAGMSCSFTLNLMSRLCLARNWLRQNSVSPRGGRRSC